MAQMSTPYNMHNVEWRRAYDGWPYTFDHFSAWYGEAALKVWEDAPEVRQHVDGIWYTNEEHIAMLRLNTVIAAAVEVELDEYILDGVHADAISVSDGKVSVCAQFG